jgi:hypothetical protein
MKMFGRRKGKIQSRILSRVLTFSSKLSPFKMFPHQNSVSISYPLIRDTCKFVVAQQCFVASTKFEVPLFGITFAFPFVYYRSKFFLKTVS